MYKIKTINWIQTISLQNLKIEYIIVSDPGDEQPGTYIIKQN